MLAAAKVAAELGIRLPLLYRWARLERLATGETKASAKPSQSLNALEAENRRLRVENAKLLEQREISKSCSVSSPNCHRTLPPDRTDESALQDRLALRSAPGLAQWLLRLGKVTSSSRPTSPRDRVTFAGNPFVQFHHRLRYRRPLRFHPNECRNHILDPAQIIEPERATDPGPGKKLPATGLGPKRKMARIGTVERNGEAQDEVSLQVSRVVADEMGAVLVANTGLDALEQAGALQQLETERARGIVEGREERETPHGVAADHALEQTEVIFDHAWVDRLRGDVNELRPRLREQEEQKKKALFVALDFETAHRHFERGSKAPRRWSVRPG